MNTSEHFWIFGHLGLGDHITCNDIYRHYANIHKDKIVIIPIWERNLSSVQWMLSDVPNIFFYPIETEQQLLICKASIDQESKLCLGFYEELLPMRKVSPDLNDFKFQSVPFNPVLWDSEFYRQAGLDPELKWKGFKLPEFSKINSDMDFFKKEMDIDKIVFHQDEKRGFKIDGSKGNIKSTGWPLGKEGSTLKESCEKIYSSTEIHCIDSSMLNLADLMETPYCKRFVFHRYARKGLPPQLKKAWEIID